MGTLNDVNSGDAANSSCIQQLIDVFKGTVGNGNIPVSVTAINDATNFALSVRNLDAVNGRSFHALDSSGGTLIQADGSGVTLKNITGGISITGGATVSNLTVTGGTTLSAGLNVTTGGITSSGPVTFSGGEVAANLRNAAYQLLGAADATVSSAATKVAESSALIAGTYWVDSNIVVTGGATPVVLHVYVQDNTGAVARSAAANVSSGSTRWETISVGGTFAVGSSATLQLYGRTDTGSVTAKYLDSMNNFTATYLSLVRVA